jgi:Helix-turn-helix domain
MESFNMAEIEPLLVSFPGALAALGLGSRTTVYELVDRGELVKVNIGRRSFITAKSLAAYVDRLTASA